MRTHRFRLVCQEREVEMQRSFREARSLRGSERLFELAERYARVRHGNRHVYHSTYIHASTHANIYVQVEHDIKVTSD